MNTSMQLDDIIRLIQRVEGKLDHVIQLLEDAELINDEDEDDEELDLFLDEDEPEYGDGYIDDDIDEDRGY